MKLAYKLILFFSFTLFISCTTQPKKDLKNKEFHGILFKNLFFKQSMNPNMFKRGVASQSMSLREGNKDEESNRETPYDGMWQFDRVNCPESTKLSPEMEIFRANPGMFAQFILDHGKFKMRVTETKKEEGLLKKCIFTATAAYQILEEKIQISESIETTEECNGVVKNVPPIASDISTILIKKNKAGEEEFIIPNQGGCVPFGGDIVLRRIPLG